MAETVSKRLEVLEFEIVQKDRLEIILASSIELVSVEKVSGLLEHMFVWLYFFPKQLLEPTTG